MTPKKVSKVVTQAQFDEGNDEGQLSLDVYQSETHIVILAPIAGVTLNDMSVSVNDDVLTIKGKRNLEIDVPDEDYFTQECFWGDFSRSIVLPASVNTSKIAAYFKDGVLRIEIPKIQKVQSKVIRIKAS